MAAPTIAPPTIAPPSKEYIERKYPHLRVQREDSFVYDVRAEYARLGIKAIVLYPPPAISLHGVARPAPGEACDFSLTILSNYARAGGEAEAYLQSPEPVDRITQVGFLIEGEHLPPRHDRRCKAGAVQYGSDHPGHGGLAARPTHCYALRIVEKIRKELSSLPDRDPETLCSAYVRDRRFDSGRHDQLIDTFVYGPTVLRHELDRERLAFLAWALEF